MFSDWWNSVIIRSVYNATIAKDVGRKNVQGMGQYKDDQKIAQASLHLSILSVVVRVHTEHAPRAHLKGMLHQY